MDNRDNENHAEDAGQKEFRFSPRPNSAAEIVWSGWGDEAFSRAQREGKLVLLSISAVWCHWCHVMDETTFSDPDIIDLINSKFIPVRVDSDKRPDVNKRYNQGGWPTVAFLTPSGGTVVGLTYAPPPTFKKLLDQVAAVYRHRRDLVDSDAISDAVKERRARDMIEPGQTVDGAAVNEVSSMILGMWDKKHGGLGDEPKFPTPGALELALTSGAGRERPELLSFVTSTLNGMMNEGFLDPVEGGFFRYSTARDWSIPHYEKMLSDNADLASIYLKASVLLEGNEDYRQAAKTVLEYMLATLFDESGGLFFGSQDADEEYYSRDIEGRSRLDQPPVDKTFYTDSNARAISALAVASAVLDDKELLSIAGKAADSLWTNGFREGAGLCHYLEPADMSPHLWGQLSDQVLMIVALSSLYQARGERIHLERAEILAKILVEQYLDEKGWLAESAGEVAEGELPTGVDLPGIPVAELDIIANGLGARVLMDLETLSPTRGFGEAARGIVESLSQRYRGYSHFASQYAMAAERLLEGPVEVSINPGLGEEERVEALRKAAMLPDSRKVVNPHPSRMVRGEEGERAPAVVVCAGKRCLSVNSIEKLGMDIISGLD